MTEVDRARIRDLEREVQDYRHTQDACDAEIRRLRAERDEWRARVGCRPSCTLACCDQDCDNAGVDDRDESAWDAIARLEASLAAAEARIASLRQAHWDGRAEGGFDNDGDPTPAAVVSSFEALILDDWRSMRATLDESRAETDAAEALAETRGRALERIRDLRSSSALGVTTRDVLGIVRDIAADTLSSPAAPRDPGLTPVGRPARDADDVAAMIMYRYDRDGWCGAPPDGESLPCCTLKAGHRNGEHIAAGEAGILGRWPVSPAAPARDEAREARGLEEAADALLAAMEGVRLPFRGEAWMRLLDLRNALAVYRSRLPARGAPDAASKVGPGGVRVTGELDTPYGLLPILSFDAPAELDPEPTPTAPPAREE